MKICLVYPNLTKLPSFFDKITNIPKEPTLLPPLGILYIISNSKNKIDFIDNRKEKLSDTQLFEKLRKYDLVGFGGTIFECLQAKNVSKALRKENVLTIYGGPNATVNWEKYTEFFDILVLGEGEYVFDDILKNLKNLKKVKGIIFKEKNKIIKTPDREFIQNLDKLNYPARDKIKIKDYERSAFPYLKVIPVDTIISSRGCPFNCAFCSSKHIWKRTYRTRTNENVIEEMKFMMDKYGTKGFYFREDNFTISPERVLDFCSKVKKLNVKWLCESRVDTVNKKILLAMKDAGCEGIWFGIESCSNKILKLIKKGITIEQAKNAIKLCKEIGITCGGGFIIGFPYETKKDMLYTIKESKKLGLDYIFYNRLWAIPKSEIFDLIKKEELDRYEYEDIIIADTKYNHADDITNIYYKTVSIKKQILKAIIPLKIKKMIKIKFPRVVRFLTKP